MVFAFRAQFPCHAVYHINWPLGNVCWDIWIYGTIRPFQIEKLNADQRNCSLAKWKSSRCLCWWCWLFVNFIWFIFMETISNLCNGQIMQITGAGHLFPLVLTNFYVIVMQTTLTHTLAEWHTLLMLPKKYVQFIWIPFQRQIGYSQAWWS